MEDRDNQRRGGVAGQAEYVMVLAMGHAQTGIEIAHVPEFGGLARQAIHHPFKGFHMEPGSLTSLGRVDKMDPFP